ncbi:MAG: Major facilitator superfamily 1 [Verrucomicrobiales bacterium]|nr:Major facilitator superfamily 1 [Verrucomicrobiales bacterium]
MVLPLLPIFAKSHLANGIMIGALMASYSLMQFIFAPIWGRLSDRIGRRPVLLVSTAGAAISYAIFAVGCGMPGSTGLAVLFVSRIFAGICGANITVAQAYIADITPPEERSKKMGLIGMAFGFGFVFGPFLSGKALQYFGVTGPGWFAAGFCAVNFIFALAALPESLKPDSTHVARRPQFAQFLHTLREPRIGLLIMIFFFATFCFACFETTLGLLVSKNFHIDPTNAADASKVANLFAYCGIVGALVQGGGIGRAVKKMGEPMLITVSLLLVGLSLLPMPFLHTEVPFAWKTLLHAEGLPWVGLLVALAALAIGSSLTRPPVFGLISNLTSASEQGTNIGVAQSVGSLARIAAPMFAAPLFDQHPYIPYITCAVISVITAIIAWNQLVGAKLPIAKATATV